MFYHHLTILTHKIEHHSICILHETFQYSCDEEPQLKLKDGSLRIFLNTATEELDNLDQKLQAFYHYIQKGTAESMLHNGISISLVVDCTKLPLETVEQLAGNS